MKLSVKELTNELFAPFGTYFNIHEGYAQESISFLPDRMLHYIGTPALESLCSIRLRYRPIEISVTEYHDDCEEVFGGFSCDIVFHTGLLGDDGTPDLESFVVFKMPAGSFVRLKRKVLHHAGFVINKGDIADGLVLLSPAAYTIDCKIITLKEPLFVDL